MRHIKILPVVIVLCMITISTMSMRPFPRHHHRARHVSITGIYDFSTFPNVVGNFTTGGALHISGSSTMQIHPYDNGTKANCVVLLKNSEGTITIHQQCNLAAGYGKWKIVCGTGAYDDLKGHGALTMPPNTEAMTGVICGHIDRDDDDD